MDRLRFFTRGPITVWPGGRQGLARRPVFEVMLNSVPWPQLTLAPGRGGNLRLAEPASPDPDLLRLRDEGDQRVLETPEAVLQSLAGTGNGAERPGTWGRAHPDTNALDYASLPFKREAARLEAMHEFLALAGVTPARPPLMVRIDRGLLDQPARAVRHRDVATLPAPPANGQPVTLVLPSSLRFRADAATTAVPLQLTAPMVARSLTGRLAQAIPEDDGLTPEEKAASIAAFLRLEESLNRIDSWPDPLRASAQVAERAYGWHRQQCFVQATAAILCWRQGLLLAPYLIMLARAQLAALTGPALADAAAPDSGGRYLAAALYTSPVLQALIVEGNELDGDSWATMDMERALAWAARVTEAHALTPQQFLDTSGFLAEGLALRDTLMANGALDDAEAQTVARRIVFLDQLGTSLTTALARRGVD